MKQIQGPTDDEVEQAVLKQPMYGRVGVDRIRMILVALECGCAYGYRFEEFLERRYKMSLVEHDEDVRTEESRLVGSHLGCGAVALEQEP
ncbi:MAG: hypothetical protein OXI96_03645 [Acidimicrobiaceae bacterium]|nr:hypothetical protein [Acidimicrobiaceae bacterium]